MSIEVCKWCDEHVDTDYNAEHFDSCNLCGTQCENCDCEDEFTLGAMDRF